MLRIWASKRNEEIKKREGKKIIKRERDKEIKR